MKIYLHTNPLLKEKYQQILTSEWTPETMRESLKLADDFLNSGQLPLGFSELIQSYENSDLPDFFISSPFTGYLKNQSVLLSSKHLPDMPERIPKRRSASKIGYSRLTLEVIYNLAFPVFAAYKNGKPMFLEGDTGFLRDIQSLVFILASEFILPFLREQRLKEESDYLNLIMFTHTLMVWHDNPAHQNQLFSIVFDNMGFHEAVIECLYTAFRLTAPEDHDYLSKAQAYWTALTDAEMYDAAKEFALRLLRSSSEDHFDEVKEIVELSFQLEHRR
ncbi:MAG: hypothetical protein R2941_01520 [Desulfobacterales bacterium]